MINLLGGCFRKVSALTKYLFFNSLDSLKVQTMEIKIGGNFYRPFCLHSVAIFNHCLHEVDKIPAHFFGSHATL